MSSTFDDDRKRTMVVCEPKTSSIRAASVATSSGGTIPELLACSRKRPRASKRSSEFVWKSLAALEQGRFPLYPTGLLEILIGRNLSDGTAI